MGAQIQLENFDKYELDESKYYGGNAGQKYAIKIDGEAWMLKFPESTVGFVNPDLSYTTSPICEYLGSQIYAALGIPVHDTRLGVRDGKVVVACKDFGKITEFKELKNSMLISDEGSSRNIPELSSSDGNGLALSDVLHVIENQVTLFKTDGVVERFWDMFLVDAIIRNQDRNNTNWGIFLNEGGEASLAPVYDNGNSFFNKRGADKDGLRLIKDDMFIQDTFGNARCCYTDNEGHAINPFKYVESTDNLDCLGAVVRLGKTLEHVSLDRVFNSVPETYQGYEVLPAQTREFYKKLVQAHCGVIINRAQTLKDDIEFIRNYAQLRSNRDALRHPGEHKIDNPTQ